MISETPQQANQMDAGRNWLGVTLKSIASRKAGFALGSQMFSSLANFMTTTVAARVLMTDTVQFTTFVLIYGLLFLANNVQMALVFKPMMIFGASLDGPKARRHFTACFIHELALAGCCWLIAFLILCCLLIAFPEYWNKLGFSLRLCRGLLLFLPLFLLHQYFRFVFFTRSQTGRVLLLDVVGFGLRIALLLIAYIRGGLTLDNIFILLAIPAALAVLCGLVLCRRILTPVPLKYALAAFGKFLPVSKWILSYNVVVWLNGNVFFFLVLWVVGMSAPGILKACVNVLGPINILFMGMANLALPIASKRFLNNQYASMSSLIKAVGLVFVMGVLGYGAIVLVKPELFFRVFYGSENTFVQYAFLMPVFIIQHVFGAMNHSYVLGMEAMRQSRKIFVSYLAAAVFSLVITVSFAPMLDLFWIAVCWCASTGLVTLLNRRSYKLQLKSLMPITQPMAVCEAVGS